MTTDMSKPHPGCPVFTGEEHYEHAFPIIMDGEERTVTCPGFARCLDARAGGASECSGPVEYRMPLSGSGASFPRCEGHWSKRLDLDEQIRERYAPDSDVPPVGFDPSYAGERWDDDY